MAEYADAPILNDLTGFRRKSVTSGQQMKFDVGRAVAEPVGETAGRVSGEEFVFRSRDMQHRGGDAAVVVTFPILGDPAADSDDAACFFRVGPDQAII